MQRLVSRAVPFAVAAVLSWRSLALSADRPVTFEEIAAQSDLVVAGSVIGPSGDTRTLPGGTVITLGVKVSGHVFTAYRVRIRECLYDAAGGCPSGELDVLIPGGTLFETVDGDVKLRTWELTGAASAPLAAAGTSVVLFLQKFQGRYRPFNDAAARLTVSTASGQDRVHVRFSSPQLLSPEGLAAAESSALAATSPERREFAEDVSLDRLKAMIVAVRGMRDRPKRLPR